MAPGQFVSDYEPLPMVSGAWSAVAGVSAPGPWSLPLSIVWRLIIAQMHKDH